MVPPPLPDMGGLQGCKLFYSQQAASEVMQRLQEALAKMGAAAEVKEEKAKLLCALVTPMGEVAFSVQLYSCPDQQGQQQQGEQQQGENEATGYAAPLAVLLRRRKGSSLKFNEIFDALLESMADLVCMSPQQAAHRAELVQANDAAVAKAAAEVATSLDIGAL